MIEALDGVLKKISPLPWPMRGSCGGEGGTTCSEENANELFSRHAANLFVPLIEAAAHFRDCREPDRTKCSFCQKGLALLAEAPTIYVSNEC